MNYNNFKASFINKPQLKGKTMEEKICLSTKRKVANDSGSVSFKCPKCLDYEIVRSTHARSNAIKYTCPKCGFEGPN
jgi:Zn-ribbon RNA-binding protein